MSDSETELNRQTINVETKAAKDFLKGFDTIGSIANDVVGMV